MSSIGISKPDGCTDRLCSWVHGLELAHVPLETQTRVKYLILDGLACAFVGSHLPWSEVAAKGIFDVESPGACSIFGWQEVPKLRSFL